MFARAMNHPGAVYLRLYTWSQGAITFGYNQILEKAVRLEALNKTPVIRRVTGGRALYHEPSELTYAVVVNTRGLDNDRLIGSVAHTSHGIAESLGLFLAELGITSQIMRRTSVKSSAEKLDSRSAPCFNSISRHEIACRGMKIVASAQSRVGAAWLQHGSIKLNGLAAHPALATKTTLTSVVPEPIASRRFHELSQVFAKIIGRGLGLNITHRMLSDSDLLAVENQGKKMEKSALNKRDIVKHSTLRKSLCK